MGKKTPLQRVDPLPSCLITEE
uniref:Uncharacterized protein n=1 Tax=Anguilla anguilla TaxID=7936 RepID=A0A0E9PVA4_ANGAN